MSLSGNMGVPPSGDNESTRVDIEPPKADDIDAAPERKLTLFAVQLAVLQRTATGLGAIGFIWATVVILGGFLSILPKRDFWFVKIILIFEVARIFSRSHELEWQHQSKFTIAHIGIHVSDFISRVIKRNKENNGEKAKDKKNNGEKATINGSTSSSGLQHTCVRWLFQSNFMSQLFYWLQLLSASACITLSVVRLLELSHDHRVGIEKIDPTLRSALDIFYGLALVEGFICLFEKLYWEGAMISYGLLEKVNENFALGSSGIDYFRRFFYDAYSECVNKSIFDALKMDLISFASKLLVSDSTDNQLIGVQILHTLSTSTSVIADKTLEKIGASMTVIERLVEMLRWDQDEAHIRQKAAQIVSKLAAKRKQYSSRIVGIPCVMDSISSLLYTQRISDSAPDELDEKKIDHGEGNDELDLSKYGLTILHALADHNNDNCEKISNTRGLLSKIIECTYTEQEWLLREPDAKDDRFLVVQQSLKVLKLLAGTSGTVGNNLRQEIAENVFTVTNIREILQFGEKHPDLQQLGIQLLTNLAFDVEATKIIGRTGGIIKELFRIFFQRSNSARNAAGEAIGMLALDCEENCVRILKQDDEIPEKLVGALEDPAIRINSARILRYLCKFGGKDCREKVLQGGRKFAIARPMLKGIMSEECEQQNMTHEERKLQEMMLGLATQVFKYMTPEEASKAFDQVGIDQDKLAMKLLKILKLYPRPPIKVPRMRRFAIKLAILLIENKIVERQTFPVTEMAEEIKKLSHTTSEIESFNVFTGRVGLSRNGATAIHTLVEKALESLNRKSNN